MDQLLKITNWMPSFSKGMYGDDGCDSGPSPMIREVYLFLFFAFFFKISLLREAKLHLLHLLFLVIQIKFPIHSPSHTVVHYINFCLYAVGRNKKQFSPQFFLSLARFCFPNDQISYQLYFSPEDLVCSYYVAEDVRYLMETLCLSLLCSSAMRDDNPRRT